MLVILAALYQTRYEILVKNSYTCIHITFHENIYMYDCMDEGHSWSKALSLFPSKIACLRIIYFNEYYII